MPSHPIYIDLNALPPLPGDEQASLPKRSERTARASAVDYPKVLAMKERYLRRSFELSGKEMLGSEAFKSFYQAAASWLRPYALYCVLRDHFGTGAPTQWAGWEVYDEDKATAYLDDPAHAEAVSYSLHGYSSSSMVRCRRYVATLKARGIFLKGDLPISGTAWRGCMAAPHFSTPSSPQERPDDFAADGQNWGFPTTTGLRCRQRTSAGGGNALSSKHFTSTPSALTISCSSRLEVPRTQHSGLLGHFHPALPIP